MKVENFRTQVFKDKVKHIALSKGYVDGKLKYNFNKQGVTKPIRICGVDYNDCVAYFRKIDDNVSTPVAITYSDIISLERDIKLSSVFGEGLEVESTRKKIVKVDPFNLKVGDKCHYMVEYRQFTSDYHWGPDYHPVNTWVEKITKSKVTLKNGQIFNLYGNMNSYGKCYWATSNGYGALYLEIGHKFN